MARRLYETETPFRETLDRCAAILDPLLPRPLFDVIFAGATDADGAPLLSQTRYTQPALVAVELALVALWRSWGVHPEIVLGHSVGEYAAAHTAGVFTLPDVLAAVAARGRLMQALPSGAGMLAVSLDEATAEAIVSAHPGLCIAAVNAAASVVLAGDEGSLTAVMASLSADGIRHQRLDVSHGFHSPAMAPMLAPLSAELARYALKPPSIPLVSNLDGGLDHDRTDPAYWARHTRAPVRFADGVETLRRQGVDTVIEIGPAAPLLGLIAQGEAPATLLPSLRRGRDDWEVLLTSLGRLYAQGRAIEWDRVFAARPWRKRLLPTMPFQRRRCWVDRPAPTRDTADVASALRRAAEQLCARGTLTAEQAAQVARLAAELLAEAPPSSDWAHLLYQPVWSAAPSPPSPPRGARWLILADRGGVGAALAARASAGGITVTCAAPGAEPPRVAVDRIVHLRALDFPGDDTAARQGAAESVLSWVPWLTAEGLSAPMSVVTRGAQSLDGQPGASLAQAVVWGLVRTLVLDGLVAWGGLIDLDPAKAATGAADDLWGALMADEQTLCRGTTRHALHLERAAPPARPAVIRPDASYLITGGVGALGLEAADALADLGARHLVLTSRRGPVGAAQMARLDALRRRGVAIATPAVDVADEAAMRALLAGLDGPPLRGVIHAAGVIAARPESAPDAERVATTLRAKVEGALVLDRLTQGAALDLFVLFSSAAGLLGLSGHADYAAANAALDALAARREARGAPALSLSWGDWAGLGMAADGSSTGIAAATGLGALPLAPARAALRGLLGARGHRAIINADWPAFVAAFGAHAQLLAPCLDARPADGADASPTAAPGSPGAEPSTPAEQVAERVAALLGRPAATLDRDENLLALGFDSLMLITLRNRLRRDLGLRIALPRMLQGPSIAALAAELAADPTRAAAGASTAGDPDEAGWTTITL
ncbi:MAG: SDR family NAD(P)-dependent oxidoreductase [Myxococcales bacterium]|nr:SDR family NAD(P)-dependent oxidoreductase [Myxococcales bacterium]